MTQVRMTWKGFYGNEDMDLSFPDDWNTHVVRIKSMPPLTDKDIERRILSPIGSERLKDLVRGKRTVCIAVDDITKPTEAHRLVPPILRELEAGGLRDNSPRASSRKL